MFRTEPILRALPQPGQWRLEKPMLWQSPQETLVIPPRFVTDLASIPRPLHSLIPVNGKHRAAAILHDYLFVIQDRPRAAVDLLFLHAMEASGVRWSQRHIMYLAVRLGGGPAWRRNARALAQQPHAHYAAHGLEYRG